MTTAFRRFASAALMTLACFCFGCSDSGDAITTDMHEDFDHEHKHQHTGDDDHEHEHDGGFKGSHSHGHTHSHRHGEPLHGGRIVSIGHTHHKGGATHFHAEVMPLADNTIRFHLLTESESGESEDYPIEVSEIPALISIKNRESASAECSFAGVGDGGSTSEFSLTIPENLQEGDAFSVVVPKVKLGGQRQNFSFMVSRGKAEDNEVEKSEDKKEEKDEEEGKGKDAENDSAAGDSPEETSDE